MFCKKCGTEIKGSEKFCPKCGEKVTVIKTENTTAGKPPVLVIGIAVIAVVLIVVLLKGVFMPGYKGVIKDYVKALENEDPELFVSLLPEAYRKLMDEEYDTDEEDLQDRMEDKMDDMQDYFDGDIKLKYSIEDVDDMTKKEISKVEGYWPEDYDVQAGKIVDLEIEVYVDGDKEETYDVELYILKIGFKWWLNPASGYQMFWVE